MIPKLPTEDKFWLQVSAKQCSEYMAHEAMAEVERLRHLLTIRGIREQTRHAARVAIRNHLAYAKEVMQNAKG